MAILTGMEISAHAVAEVADSSGFVRYYLVRVEGKVKIVDTK